MEGFAVGVAFAFCSLDQGSLSESRSGRLVPLTIYPVTQLPIMIRRSDSPTLQGGKVPNQANDDLRLHQGAPRAALGGWPTQLEGAPFNRVLCD